MEQILLNLLGNAVKFTEKGTVRVECSAQPDMVMVRVIDSGIGIKAADLDRLLQPFRQIDSGITRKFEGTGLGLFICKKLVELLRGTIGVDSEWGQAAPSISLFLPPGTHRETDDPLYRRQRAEPLSGHLPLERQGL